MNTIEMNEYLKEYRKTHKAEIREQQRIYRSRNQDKCKEYYRRYYRKNKQKVLERKRSYRKRIKEEILTHYGNGELACIRCGYSNIDALSIDHINGNGGEHRKTIGNSIYGWLRTNNYPEGYQTLCMNCQMIKKDEELDRV